MDRGYRAVLIFLAIGGMGGVTTGKLPAQTPTNTATPWVQALPTPKPSPEPFGTPVQPPVGATPKPSPPPKPVAGPKPAATATKGSMEETRVRMQRERELEVGGAPSAELSPDDAATFNRNQQLWNKLSPEEQAFVRGQVNPRMQQEIDGAYVESGLNLDNDQREVFALRYRQERRRLEREIQDKARAERSRRLPQIVDQLRKEFGKGPGPGPGPARLPGGNPGPPRPMMLPPTLLVPVPTIVPPPGPRVGWRRRMRRRNFGTGRRVQVVAWGVIR